MVTSVLATDPDGPERPPWRRARSCQLTEATAAPAGA